MLGFGTVADGHWLLARLRSDAAMDRLAPEHSADWRSLGVSILHVLVLERAARRRSATRPCRYVHSHRRGARRRGRPRLRPGLPRPPRRHGATSRRSPRTSRRCPPRAPTSIPSCSRDWCSTRSGVSRLPEALAPWPLAHAQRRAQAVEPHRRNPRTNSPLLFGSTLPSILRCIFPTPDLLEFFAARRR